MIITRLQGGLGNQMFQYAAARSLALRNNTVLKLDLGFLKDGILGANVAYRNYELNSFKIVENIIEKDEAELFKKRAEFYFKTKIAGLNKRFAYQLPIKKIYAQNGHGFNPDFNKLSRNTYLIGYWQNVKYFEKYESIIRADFTFRYQPNDDNNKIINSISNCESVAVHIRQGDFKQLDQLGTTSLEYYFEAIDFIKNRIVNPVFYFFSDDIEWVSQKFSGGRSGTGIELVDINKSSGRVVDDLRLMTHCKHNIIGNSTYGWWGAWLNANPGKIVISPKKLFSDSALDHAHQGMIPDTWLRI